jgi:hypothetical protein
MTVRFLAPARIELREAIAYYNNKELHLGSGFGEAVKRAASSIVQYPLAGHRLLKLPVTAKLEVFRTA